MFGVPGGQGVLRPRAVALASAFARARACVLSSWRAAVMTRVGGSVVMRHIAPWWRGRDGEDRKRRGFGVDRRSIGSGSGLGATAARELVPPWALAETCRDERRFCGRWPSRKATEALNVGSALSLSTSKPRLGARSGARHCETPAPSIGPFPSGSPSTPKAHGPAQLAQSFPLGCT